MRIGIIAVSIAVFFYFFLVACLIVKEKRTGYFNEKSLDDEDFIFGVTAILLISTLVFGLIM